MNGNKGVRKVSGTFLYFADFACIPILQSTSFVLLIPFDPRSWLRAVAVVRRLRAYFPQKLIAFVVPGAYNSMLFIYRNA